MTTLGRGEGRTNHSPPNTVADNSARQESDRLALVLTRHPGERSLSALDHSHLGTASPPAGRDIVRDLIARTPTRSLPVFCGSAVHHYLLPATGWFADRAASVRLTGLVFVMYVLVTCGTRCGTL